MSISQVEAAEIVRGMFAQLDQRTDDDLGILYPLIRRELARVYEDRARRTTDRLTHPDVLNVPKATVYR